MERFSRLLPFRSFGRLRHLRSLVPCLPIGAAQPTHRPHTASLFDDEPQDVAGSGSFSASSAPSSQPAFARVSLNSGLNNATPSRRGPVRVYQGSSRLIMVGTVDAVCNMIDRCIAEERAVFESA